MPTQEKSFSIYGSETKIAPAIVVGTLIYGVIWSLQQLFSKHWTIINAWDWIPLFMLPSCILVAFYMVYYAIKLHKEPVLVIDKQGINVYKFGFIPWHEVQALRIIEKTSRMLYRRVLTIQLKKGCKPQPVGWFDKLFLHADWDASTHTITVNIHSLKAGPRKLAHIFEQLIEMVPNLKNIDHAGLYEHHAALSQEKSFPIYVSKKRSWIFALGIIFASGYIIGEIIRIFNAAHEGLSWQLLWPAAIIALMALGIWIGAHELKILHWQKEPELIFNEDGIVIHTLGLVPWLDIQRIGFERGGGRFPRSYLFLKLAHNSTWKPIEQKRFGLSTFNDRNKTITIECNYLNAGRRNFIDIYEALMMAVPRLHDIDHSELY